MDRRRPSRETWRAAEQVQVALATLLAVAGLALALLPHEWIEETSGVEPDGGSGLVELLPVVVLIAGAAVLALRVVRSRRAASASVGRAAAD